MIPRTARIFIILWILLGLINAEPLVLSRASTSGQNAEAQEVSEASIFFPLAAHFRRGPDIRSPFSLQIAAFQLLQEGALENGSISNQVLGEKSTAVLENQAYTNLVSALKDSGADWARVRLEWEHIEPNAPVDGQSPEYYWQFYDDALGSVAEADVRIIATVSDSPSWAADVPCAPIHLHRLDEYSRFIKDLVTRYRGHPYYINHWELVNEPDSNRYTTGHLSGHGCWAYDGDRYADMLAVAFNTIKKVDPQAQVLMGGIAYDWFEEYGGPFYRYFPDEVMQSGGGSYMDALNFHFYTDFSPEWDRWNPKSPDRRYGWIPAPTCGVVDDGLGAAYEVSGFDIVAKTTHYQNRMNTCYGVTKPVWVTEVGDHGYPGDQNSLDNQARYVIKVYTRALSAGVKNVTWYSLDRPLYDRYEQALLNLDLSPKPAFIAYQTLTRELNGYYEYSHDRNNCSWGDSGVSCSVEAYVFKDDNQNEVTVAWGSDILKFSANKLRIVDRNGKETIVKDGSSKDNDGIVNGKIKLKLSKEPLFIIEW